MDFKYFSEYCVCVSLGIKKSYLVSQLQDDREVIFLEFTTLANDRENIKIQGNILIVTGDTN